MIFNKRPIIVIGFICLLQCAAFPDKVLSSDRTAAPFAKERVKIVFTGFYRFDFEKKLVLEKLVQKGFIEDTNSSKEIQIILQKRDSKYNYPLLHAANWFLTFFTAGMIPYHIRSEQTLTFRYSDQNKILKESVFNIGMDQWRGIPVVIFTPTNWPSKIYSNMIKETVELERFQN
ncbi:hypothetical protein P3G55_19645 [Leptospira sp. 96542]|nr:hypothetical protein [Leptospira sp. 96542]